MDLASSVRAAEKRTGRKRIVAKSSVVPPMRFQGYGKE